MEKKRVAKKKRSSKRSPAKKKRAHTKTARKVATQKSPITINMPPYPQSAQSSKDTGVNQVMLENFVALQRVLTNLSTKMEGLTTQLGKLLDLFEISAKALADREFEIEKDNKETLDKMNVLLDQNKTLARGLSLMHERMPAEQFPHPAPQPMIPSPTLAPTMTPFPAPQMPLGNEPPKRALAQEVPSQNNPGMPSMMPKPSSPKAPWEQSEPATQEPLEENEPTKQAFDI